MWKEYTRMASVRISTQTERELVLEKGSTISTKGTGLHKTPQRGREKRRETETETETESAMGVNKKLCF